MNRTDFQDFARSILRMDDERMLWWERSQELAKKCDALTAERDTALAERDSLRGAVTIWHDSSINERVNGNTARKERDDARDELHRVGEENAKLAARVTELEARLAAVAPVAVAPVEVDGFRVGDLVQRSRHCVGHRETGVVTRVDEWVKVKFPCSYESAYSPLQLTRKPVEVGDTVRVVEGSYVGVRGLVHSIVDGDMYVALENGWGTRWLSTRHLVAVAP